MTPTEGGELTEVVPSLERTTPRLTDPLPMPPDGSPSLSSRLVLQRDASSRYQVVSYGIFRPPIRPYFSFLQCFLLQVSYAIGVAEPLSVTVFDYGTGTKSSAELNEIVKKNFDLR